MLAIAVFFSRDIDAGHPCHPPISRYDARPDDMPPALRVFADGTFAHAIIAEVDTAVAAPRSP